MREEWCPLLRILVSSIVLKHAHVVPIWVCIACQNGLIQIHVGLALQKYPAEALFHDPVQLLIVSTKLSR